MASRKLKYLLKSRSYQFVKDISDKSHDIKSISWNDHNVFYRTSTSDMILIYEILLKSKYKSEYFFPQKIDPRVIFDIGGNIGITSIYLASLFPKATIYVFEPLLDNFEILKRNISNYKNIQAFNFGLGSKNGDFKIYLSKDDENFGGVSFYPNTIGNKADPFESCRVMDINKVFEDLNIKTIDLIKIDTEGAEFDILTSMEDKILQNVSWITGELHGNRDFELLTYLDKLGFSISLNKKIDNRLFMFHAGKPKIFSQLSKKDIRAL